MSSSSGAALEAAPRWLRARSRNVLRRPVFLSVVTGLAFIVSLLGLVLIPREVNRFARAMAPPPEERPDTAALQAATNSARRTLMSADAMLARARESNVRRAIPVEPVDTFPPAAVARRDTLRSQIATLGQLLERAELAPLPASYRAIAASPPLAGSDRVRILLDTLAAIEREREAFGLIGGVDPVFVALTARATTVGKSIAAIADSARRGLRRELAALLPPPPPPVEDIPVVDTMPLVARRDSAVAALERSVRALEEANVRLADIDRRLAAARELANVAAPPIAMLAAAVVLGIVVGFAIAMLRELWWPRVGEPLEVERLTGARVLAVINPRPAPAERSRRRADRETPPLIHLTDDDFRLLHDHLATAATASVLTVTGDEAGVVAAVAANVAAYSANEARTTLLVDADLEHCAIAGVMRVRAEPGIGDILAGRADWAESIAAATVGRDCTVFVIPSGRCDTTRFDEGAASAVRTGLARMARRYDVVVLALPLALLRKGGIGVLPAPEVVLCARVAHTPLAELRQSVEAVRASGARVRGIVLWRADLPHAPTHGELEAAARLSADESEPLAAAG